jgi:hypothetical protein
LGREAITDPTTGKVTYKRRQKWIAFRGNKRQAQAKLADLLGDVNKGTFVGRAKDTVIEVGREWWKTYAVPPLVRPETSRVYHGMIEQHLAPTPLALRPIQDVRAIDSDRFYLSIKRSPATIGVALISGRKSPRCSAPTDAARRH